MPDAAGATHAYAAFGLTVASTLALPELARAAPVDRSAADVVIDRAPVDPPGEGATQTAGGEGLPLRAAAPDEHYLSYPVGDLRVRSGREIAVDPSPGAPRGVVRAVVVGPAFNHLLHQRGFYVLHASVVSVDGGAVAFVGRSGDGKSTTAAAFLRRGHRVLSDDVAAVRRGDDDPAVTPGHPTVKLDPAAVASLALPVERRGRTSVRDRRFFRLPHGRADAPVPLRRVYLLEDGPAVGVDPVPPGEGAVELVRHTYTAGLLADRGEARSNFGRCARLAEALELRRLRRPRDLDELPAVVEAVESDLDADA